jgi:hypothetical protein
MGVSSEFRSLGVMLPSSTRTVVEEIYDKVRPARARRMGAGLLGRLLMRQAIGAPRVAVPATE